MMAIPMQKKFFWHLHAASEPSGSQHHESFVRVSLSAKRKLFTGLAQWQTIDNN